MAINRPDDVDVSRVISHALRHEPWLYDLKLDQHGWANLDDLLDALRSRGAGWEHLGRSDIDRVVTTGSKQRHEIDGDRIRALYGHSTQQSVPELQPRQPPKVLFHGTNQRAWKVIRREGLKPMGRRFVHLSRDVATATQVGARRGPQLAILQVDAQSATESNILFYPVKNGVWLANYIPIEFISAHA